MLDYRTHTFLEVYRKRSYTIAAQSLLITQPAVSQHIRQLEAHYGCPLFTKTGRGIEPTAAADLLYQRLLTLENDERRMVDEVAQLVKPTAAASHAPLKLGCTRTIADYVAPRFISRHLRAHPDAPLLMESGNTRELVERLEQGGIDFALVEGSFDHDRFDSQVFSREDYIAVAGSDWTGEPRPRDIRDLLGQTLILREAGSGTREILEKHLAARDLSIAGFAGIIEIASIPTIKECVKAGSGISFVYRVAVQEELDSGELVNITPDNFAVEHDFCLIWQHGSQYAKRFQALCSLWSRP